MDEAGLGADMLGEVGEKRDDVVLDLALDGVDPFDLEGALLPDGGRASFGMTPSSASASQAWASISNQIRNLVSGSQICAISARV